VNKYPDMGSPIRGKLTELQDDWHELVALAGGRRAALEAAHLGHKFRAELRELQLWVQDTIKRMDSSEPPTNIAEAKEMLELHHERKVCWCFLF
jgi:spectrin beta